MDPKSGDPVLISLWHQKEKRARKKSHWPFLQDPLSYIPFILNKFHFTSRTNIAFLIIENKKIKNVNR